MHLLAIDTSGAASAAAIIDGRSGAVSASVSRDIGRGHAELLIDQVNECLAEAALTFNDLDRLAVTIGPGSFTGVRVGMAAVRGFALALDLPVVGVSTLDALAALAREQGHEGDLAILLDARRGEAYFRIDQGQPQLVSYADIEQQLKAYGGAICGSGCLSLAPEVLDRFRPVHEAGIVPIETIARFAITQTGDGSMPEPLYLRGADAKVQSGFALPRAANET
ncbi:MAG: tRNA (adenosine(37)-N6)-threonylcarbamoyltransferase complex dimerization subunit type 1 TsaB [Pseudomonadota bacterium]